MGTAVDVHSYTLDCLKLITLKHNKNKNIDYNLLGLGKVFIEFNRPDTAIFAQSNFTNRSFEGRMVTIRFYSLKSYQKNFLKGITTGTNDEKIQLSLKTQEKLMFSDVKLFPRLKIS